MLPATIPRPAGDRDHRRGPGLLRRRRHERAAVDRRWPAWRTRSAPRSSTSDDHAGTRRSAERRIHGHLRLTSTNVPKPIIAAINGPCAGIGLIFTLYCDLRYVAEDAKLTTSFAQRGLIAEHGLSWLLPRLVGEATALDLLLTARKFTGAEAARLGMVNAALPQEGFIDHVMGVARHLATQVSPRSVAVMKRQIRRAYHQTFADALATADAEMEKSFGTFDFKEGVASFVERRAPLFRGS